MAEKIIREIKEGQMSSSLARKRKRGEGNYGRDTKKNGRAEQQRPLT